jgi:hypothetical protein
VRDPLQSCSASPQPDRRGEGRALDGRTTGARVYRRDRELSVRDGADRMIRWSPRLCEFRMSRNSPRGPGSMRSELLSQSSPPTMSAPATRVARWPSHASFAAKAFVRASKSRHDCLRPNSARRRPMIQTLLPPTDSLVAKQGRGRRRGGLRTWRGSRPRPIIGLKTRRAVGPEATTPLAAERVAKGPARLRHPAGG